jgi:hypothetical protein
MFNRSFVVCPTRKASGTTKPKGSGYCAALRGDGTASRKAQSRARHNFQCARFAYDGKTTSKVTLVKIGPRTPKLGEKLAALCDKFNNQ